MLPLEHFACIYVLMLFAFLIFLCQYYRLCILSLNVCIGVFGLTWHHLTTDSIVNCVNHCKFGLATMICTITVEFHPP